MVLFFINTLGFYLMLNFGISMFIHFSCEYNSDTYYSDLKKEEFTLIDSASNLLLQIKLTMFINPHKLHENLLDLREKRKKNT